MPLQIIEKDAKEFVPHMAATSMMLNDGAANERNVAVIQKSKTAELLKKFGLELKAVDESTEDETLEKASANNTLELLCKKVDDRFCGKSGKKDEYGYDIWTYAYVVDFDPEESIVLFKQDGQLFSVSYSIGEAGDVELGDDVKEAVKHTVYESKDTPVDVDDKDGEKSGEVDSPLIKSKTEDIMSDEMIKQDELEAILVKAKADLRAEIEAEYAEKELIKSTTAAMDAFAFIEKEDVAEMVKGLVANPEALPMIVKAFESANKALEAKDVELVKVKEEFANGVQESDGGDPASPEELDYTALAKAQTAKVLAARAANK